MSDISEAYSSATRCIERLPGPGNLERSMVILARAGVSLPAIRSWAVQAARTYGIWDYVRAGFARSLGVAVAEAIETRRLELQQRKGV
jgi:hypothetical protein